MISILIITVLFIFWLLNKKSTNNYFIFTKGQKLKDDFELLIKIYSNFEIKFSDFEKAWWYFREYPEEYNGSSIINDRFLIKGLEPFSVEHDYAWIMAKSFSNLHVSNLEYCKKLRKVNSNWFWVWGFIFCGLTLVSIFKSIKYI